MRNIHIVRILALTAICGSILLFSAVSAVAFNPRGVDILTLRLGMSVDDAIARLHAQGIPSAQIQRFSAPCVDEPLRLCVAKIVARTKDGELTIELTELVRNIAYRFYGRAVGEAQMIRRAVLDRFGPPTSREPLTWCDPPNGSALCEAHRPRLTFVPEPDGGGTLSLVAGSAVRR
jgi:hypothetical protein